MASKFQIQKFKNMQVEILIFAIFNDLQRATLKIWVTSCSGDLQDYSEITHLKRAKMAKDGNGSTNYENDNTYFNDNNQQSTLFSVDCAMN